MSGHRGSDQTTKLPLGSTLDCSELDGHEWTLGFFELLVQVWALENAWSKQEAKCYRRTTTVLGQNLWKAGNGQLKHGLQDFDRLFAKILQQFALLGGKGWCRGGPM